MSLSTPPRPKFSALEITTLAMMGALIFAVKLALSGIPNIQLNAPLMILTTVFFGWKALCSVAIYVLLEGLFFGFHVYWVSYVFIWPLLVVLAMFLRRFDLFQGENAALPWAVAAAFWGLLFGPLMYIPWFCIMGGWEGYFAMWIAGIPFDLTHMAGNFVFTLVLYWPLYKVLAALTARQNHSKPN